jgi:hypothetical protein
MCIRDRDQTDRKNFLSWKFLPLVSKDDACFLSMH